MQFLPIRTRVADEMRTPGSTITASPTVIWPPGSECTVKQMRRSRVAIMCTLSPSTTRGPFTSTCCGPKNTSPAPTASNCGTRKRCAHARWYAVMARLSQKGR